MHPTWLEDEDGYPRTASIHFGWIVLIVTLTSGTAALLLQFYLCLWVFKKTRATRSLVAFLSLLVCGLVDLLIKGWIPKPALITANLVVVASYVIAALILRSDIQASLRQTQGRELEIAAFPTCLFSATYINLCLVPLPPFDSPMMASPVTTLNLSPTSAKITK